MATTTLTGTTGNDILNAPGSVSTLVQGLQGNDTITLALSVDSAEAGKGNDTVVYQATGNAANTVFGGDGNDTIFIQSANTFTGYIDAGSGADSIAITSSGTATISNGQIFGGLGNDTISLLNIITTSTIGGGSGADLLTFTGASAITSTVINGGESADTIRFAAGGSLTTGTVQGGKGFDLLTLSTTFTTTNSLIGTGQGNDSIAISTGAYNTTSIAGGTGNDTINILSQLAGTTTIYGDTNGDASGSDGDGNDFIFGTQGLTAAAASIYGAGGNDTIALLGVNTSQLIVDAGNGADSIRVWNAGGRGSISGGAGNDTITYGTTGTVAVDNTTLATINGGAGNDTIQWGTGLGTIDATPVSSTQVNMIVAYGSGDVLRLDTTLGTTQSNWAAGGVYVLSTADLTGLAGAGNVANIGSVGVYSDGTDSWLTINTVAAATSSSNFVVQIKGKDLTTTTLFGTQALNASNFGFSVNYAGSAAGISITLT